MKNKNIHILPTENSSRLSIDNGVITLHRPQWRKGTQHIYITSDEYIGLSYYLDGSLVRKGVVDDKDYWEVRKDYKKIILTTDQDLIKDGVQAIDDEFLEWFFKNRNCESVEVIPLRKSSGYYDEKEVWHWDFLAYKIIIPSKKEELTSCACGANASCQCEEPKEKTFEEILSKMTLVNPKHLRMTSNGHGEFPDGYMLTEDGVKYIVKQLKNK